MLADPEIDAVSIVTMWDQHTEPAVAALEAGKHVFLEKPIASPSPIARRSSPRRRRRRASCSSATSAASTRATAWPSRRSTPGTIGKIVSLSSRRNIPAAWTPEILNKIGPIVGDAIHDTDLMLWFTGDRVVSAYAQTVDVRGLKHPDIGQTMYRFAGGATATLETVWCMPEKTPFDIDERMSIIGTEGFIHVQDTFPNLGIVCERQVPQPRHDLLAGVRRRARRRLAGGIRLFRRLHRKRKRPTIGTPEDATAALAATLAAEESARTGQVVKIG